MKNKILMAMLIMLCIVSFAAAQDVAFSMTTDFAYYPESAPIPAAEGTRFATLTGPYSGLEARTVGTVAYTIPVPFGDNPLVSGNTLVLKSSLELSPVSIAPGVSFSFTPVAFLVFNGGANIGTAWDLMGIKGVAKYNDAAHGYDTLPAFETYRYSAWAGGTFQFDLAAIMPGEWNHVVTMDSFEVTYKGVTGVAAGDPWLWQGAGEQVNGLSYNASFILGYQMPLVLSTVALQGEINGRFSNDMAAQYAAYKSDYTTYSVNPVAIFAFDEHNSLTTQLCFTSRRGYATKCDKETQTNLNLTTTGSEWYFNRIAFSWSYSF